MKATNLQGTLSSPIRQSPIPGPGPPIRLPSQTGGDPVTDETTPAAQDEEPPNNWAILIGLEIFCLLAAILLYFLVRQNTRSPETRSVPLRLGAFA